uniref:rubredoxin n=1 Tax=Erigeron canadensis TaxID=72917 RepID=UPI001CB8CC3F|nr:rubredoxin [Erigeron canadensis]
MASAASATFRLTNQLSSSSSAKPKPPQLIFPSKPYTFSPFHTTPPKLHLTFNKCIDVSKEDRPISDTTPPPEPEKDFDLSTEETQEEFDKRRLEEKFAVLNTGIYECRSCGYLYNEAAGDPSYPIAPGLPFEKLPEDWRCATCGAAKSFFQSKSVEIAGFAQNQQFGLGGNTLTAGQKAILIYGSLLFFFVLFLSGYFLQ